MKLNMSSRGENDPRELPRVSRDQRFCRFRKNGSEQGFSQQGLYRHDKEVQTGLGRLDCTLAVFMDLHCRVQVNTKGGHREVYPMRTHYDINIQQIYQTAKIGSRSISSVWSQKGMSFQPELTSIGFQTDDVLRGKHLVVPHLHVLSKDFGYRGLMSWPSKNRVYKIVMLVGPSLLAAV